MKIKENKLFIPTCIFSPIKVSFHEDLVIGK